MTVVCAGKEAANQVRAVFVQHGVLMDFVDKRVSRVEPGNPITYLTINYQLQTDTEAHIRAALSKIAGITLQ
jgi:hypothetical protein